MRKLTTWRKYLIKRLATNREETINFLDAIMEEFHIYGNLAALQSALQAVVEAQGGISELAALQKILSSDKAPHIDTLGTILNALKRTHMSPDALQKILSSDKAPHIDTLGTILNALGCRLSIEPLEVANTCSEFASEN
jgi:DNA-binding phage protein